MLIIKQMINFYYFFVNVPKYGISHFLIQYHYLHLELKAKMSEEELLLSCVATSVNTSSAMILPPPP